MAEGRSSWFHLGLTVLLTVLSVVATLAWAQGAEEAKRIAMHDSITGLTVEVKHLADSVGALSLNTAAINAQVLEHLHTLDGRIDRMERHQDGGR